MDGPQTGVERVRIDPADAMTPSSGAEPTRRKVEPRAKETDDARPSEVPAGPEPDTRGYVEKARAAGAINTAAVAEARRLLESGELDTPEAARRAAEAILEQGL